MEEVKNMITEALRNKSSFTQFVKDALKHTTIGVEMEFQYAYNLETNIHNIRSVDKIFNFELNSFQKTNSVVEIGTTKLPIKDFSLLESVGNDGGGKEFRFKPVSAKEYIDNLDKFAKLFNYLQQLGFRNSTGDGAGTHIHLDRSKFKSLANIAHFIRFNKRNADSLDRLWRRTGRHLSSHYTFRDVDESSIERFIGNATSFTDLNGRIINSCLKANDNGVGTFEFRNFNSSFDLRLFVARIVYLAASAHVYSLGAEVSNSILAETLLGRILMASELLGKHARDIYKYFDYTFLYESLSKLDIVKEVEETVLKPVVA